MDAIEAEKFPERVWRCVARTGRKGEVRSSWTEDRIGEITPKGVKGEIERVEYVRVDAVAAALRGGPPPLIWQHGERVLDAGEFPPQEGADAPTLRKALQEAMEVLAIHAHLGRSQESPEDREPPGEYEHEGKAWWELPEEAKQYYRDLIERVNPAWVKALRGAPAGEQREPTQCDHDWYRPMQPAATSEQRCRRCGVGRPQAGQKYVNPIEPDSGRTFHWDDT